jgi:hypothetical protein
MIKAAGIAGAAAWTAPVIIDSLASPAAAVTLPPCASCPPGTTVMQAGYHVTNSGSQGTATCPAAASSAPVACQPTCYTVGADTCTVPFTVTTNKAGNSVGVVFRMNGGATFLSGMSYGGGTCRSGSISSLGGTSIMTFTRQLANNGYDIWLTWCE